MPGSRVHQRPTVTKELLTLIVEQTGARDALLRMNLKGLQ